MTHDDLLEEFKARMERRRCEAFWFGVGLGLMLSLLMVSIVSRLVLR